MSDIFARLEAFDANNKLVTCKRIVRFQAIGKIAAMAIPTAEMHRLWVECDGNLDKGLAPIREALRAEGFTSLFVLPAQTMLVKAIEYEPSHGRSICRGEDPIGRCHAQLRAICSAGNALLRATAVSKETERARESLQRQIAEAEVELQGEVIESEPETAR